MWVMEPEAFTSTVYKGGALQMRARDRASLERFCALSGVNPNRIVEGGGTDYAYRIRRVSKKDLKRYYSALVDQITYSNFKDEAKSRKGARYAGALSRVWSAMFDLTPLDVQRRTGWGDYLSKRPAAPTTTVDVAEVTAEDVMRITDEGDFQEALDALEEGGYTDLLAEIDVMLAKESEAGKSIHDMTEDEWRALMESNPSGI